MLQSTQEITEILHECEAYCLDMGAAASKSLEGIRKAYNGCGPESFPKELRSKIDGIAKLYRAAVLVHDCDFDDSDGKSDTLQKVTDRFRANTRKILRKAYPFWTKRQFSHSYRAERAKAVAMKELLDFAVSPFFSTAAWHAAKEARVK